MPQSVLIVDDSLPLHALIKTQLKTEPLKFHSAYNGESALLTASSFRPDLILLDVDMPGLNGFDVCRRLKANPLTSSIHVIFLTADSMTSDKVTGLEAGAADYVVKPFKPEELKARVRAALRETRQLEDAAMIDPTTGLWNRNYFQLQQKAQLSLAKRTGKPASCIVIDVDHWTSIVANSGESAGNEILRTISRIITAKARVEDVVCRIDSSKVAMLLTSASGSTAASLGERLRTEIERQLRARDGESTGVTCSVGVADSSVSSKTGLLERAEAAAEKAQAGGHNCVFVARESGTPISIAA